MLGFDWNDGNAEHIAKHGVTPIEVEEVIANDPFDLGTQIRSGEERLAQVGETNTGRVLFVVSTMRQELIRIVTAHPADRFIRKWYAQQRKARNAKDDRYSAL